MRASLNIILIAVLAGAVFSCQNIKDQIDPAKPVLVSHEATPLQSKISDYTLTVRANVRNDGGRGDVVFEVTLYQKTEKWTKTMRMEMAPHETTTFSIDFPEAELLSSPPKYQVRVYPG